MKTKFFVLLGLGFILAQQLYAQSPCINGTRSYPIYKMGAQMVEKFDAEGAEIVRIEYDLIFTSKESFRNLSPEWEYLIIGFADAGVKDLDVKVYENTTICSTSGRWLRRMTPPTLLPWWR